MKNFAVLRLILLSLLIKATATLKRIPSNRIDTWIRIWAARNFLKLGYARALQLFVSPISSIRYFEFDFSIRHMKSNINQRILDVSSPRALALYFCKTFQSVNYTMINPDNKDRQETDIQARALEINNFKVMDQDATKLEFPDNIFDTVVSISVIEHIKGNGDSKAIQEFWRVLTPGGKLILTTHISKQKRVEYRDHDQYNLSRHKKSKYFFQRVYDEESFKERILSHIPIKPSAQAIWGEKEKGWFDAYINRWISHGIEETAYDPWYMSTRFKNFESVNQLPGIGVIGVVFEKPR